MFPIKRTKKNYDPFRNFFDWDDSIFGLTLFPNERVTSSLAQEWMPALDVEEDKDNITVKADLPGLRKEEITVSLDENVLTIKGERKSASEKKEKNYHRMERFYGSFQRSLRIDKSFDAGKVKADYKNGVLEIVLPKKEEDKVKQIQVNVE